MRLGPGLAAPSDAATLRACQRRIDAHFDRLAEIARTAASGGTRSPGPWADTTVAGGIGDLWPLARAVGDAHLERERVLLEQLRLVREDQERARQGEAIERRREHVGAGMRATLETWAYRLIRLARALRARVSDAH